jgi:soluble lytic murein transglycosylase-like protein
MIKSAASANDLPADFLLRVIWQESRFKSDAIGPVTRGVREAVGIWRGAISGNMKISF